MYVSRLLQSDTETKIQSMACKGSNETGCCAWPLGKGLGGGSSINFMAYVRGNPEDFEEWKRQGAEGWSYADVLL